MADRTCAVDGCNRKSHARGWCGRHYRSWKKYGDPTRAIGQGTDQAVSSCHVEGCAKQAHARGWCRRHYESWRKRGTPIAVDDDPRRRTVDNSGRPVGECPSVSAYSKGCRCDDCRSAALAYQREWRDENPERWRELRARNNRKYRASKRGVPSEPYTKGEILARDGNKCGLCSKKINPRHAYPHPMSASIDHIVPLSDGGTDLRSNVQASHLVCNVSKGNRPRGEQLLLVG